MPTIKDVAQKSGLSVGTVSRYLNGNKLRKENEEKIKAAIEVLDFNINLLAKGLKTRQTYMIGVIVTSTSDPFSNQVIEGIDGIIESSNYSLLITSSRNNHETEKAKLKFLKERRVDGIILMPVSSNQGNHIQEILNSEIPVILIDKLVSGVICDAVVSDNHNGAYQAVSYLINHGHRKIGMVSGPLDLYTARQRYEGYCQALLDYNIDYDPKFISFGKYERGGGLNAIQNLISLNTPPTAIFSTNYETTISCVKYMLEKRIKIGDEISFCGFDNSDLFQLITPTITTVIQPMTEIGEAAMRLLHIRLNGDFNSFPCIINLPVSLYEGNSVAFYK